MGILEEINSLVKSAAAMPPQNPVVPGIGNPPPAGKIAPPEVKTPAPPVPPPHKSELPVDGDAKKVNWLKDWMAKKQLEEKMRREKFLNREEAMKRWLRRF